MSAPKCPLCGVEMEVESYGTLACNNLGCGLCGKYTDKEIAKLTDPNPWRPIAEVPRDGDTVVEVLCGDGHSVSLAGPYFVLPDRDWKLIKATYYRIHTPPPEPREAWERAWEDLPVWLDSKQLRSINGFSVTPEQFSAIFKLGQAAAKEGK